MIVYGRSCQPGVSRVIALLRLGASVGCLRESASSSIPPEPTSVRVSCGGPWSLASSRGGGSQCDLQIWWIGRYGASDAFKLAVNGASRRSGSRWPDSASGLALLRLAAVNGLQSCGPTLGIDSMQSVGACVAACGGGWGEGESGPRVL